MPDPTKILILAGEVSGDHHGADLVAALQEKSEHSIEFIGMGGDHMKAQGVQLLYHISQLAFLGITEIIRHLPFILKIKKELTVEMKKGIDAIILVDYPGFNLRMAKVASELGIPVIYYISPQLWAWGGKRVEKIRKYVDLMLVLFRFEKDFYSRHDIETSFVGHPLVDQIKPEKDDRNFRQEHHIPDDTPILALLPGSREMEVQKLLPVMLEAARTLTDQHQLIPIIGCSEQLPADLYQDIIPKESKWKSISGQTHRLMQHAKLALVASGTATLELGYLQTPMIVLYRVSPVTYYFGKMVIKIPNIALANIVLGKTVVPEFIQKELNPTQIAAAAEQLLTDHAAYADVKKALGGVRVGLGDPGASQRAAAVIWDYMKTL